MFLSYHKNPSSAELSYRWPHLVGKLSVATIEKLAVPSRIHLFLGQITNSLRQESALPDFRWKSIGRSPIDLAMNQGS